MISSIWKFLYPSNSQPRQRARSTPQDQRDQYCSGDPNSTENKENLLPECSREPNNAMPPTMQEFSCSKGPSVVGTHEAATSKATTSSVMAGCGSHACSCKAEESTTLHSGQQDCHTADAKQRSGKVLFGSQKGTSARFARQLAETARAQGMQLTVTDLAAFEVEQLWKEQLVVIVTSTYEDGRPPQNARCPAKT